MSKVHPVIEEEEKYVETIDQLPKLLVKATRMHRKPNLIQPVIEEEEKNVETIDQLPKLLVKALRMHKKPNP